MHLFQISNWSLVEKLFPLKSSIYIRDDIKRYKSIQNVSHAFHGVFYDLNTYKH